MGLVTASKFEAKSKTNSYMFSIYTPDTEFKETYGGVYIFTKRGADKEGKFLHSIIYIGKTNSFNTRFNSHEKWTDIVKHGANCVCILKTDSEKQSLDIEKDLLGNNNTPLNVQHNS